MQRSRGRGSGAPHRTQIQGSGRVRRCGAATSQRKRTGGSAAIPIPSGLARPVVGSRSIRACRCVGLQTAGTVRPGRCHPTSSMTSRGKLPQCSPPLGTTKNKYILVPNSYYSCGIPLPVDGHTVRRTHQHPSFRCGRHVLTEKLRGRRAGGARACMYHPGERRVRGRMMRGATVLRTDPHGSSSPLARPGGTAPGVGRGSSTRQGGKPRSLTKHVHNGDKPRASPATAPSPSNAHSRQDLYGPRKSLRGRHSMEARWGLDAERFDGT